MEITTTARVNLVIVNDAGNESEDTYEFTFPTQSELHNWLMQARELGATKVRYVPKVQS